jgi:hypothetical protein
MFLKAEIHNLKNFFCNFEKRNNFFGDDFKDFLAILWNKLN